MRRSSVLWCAFMTRFVEAHRRYQERGLTAEEAGELLGMSARHFSRRCVRYDDEGVVGLRDRRLGRVSSRRGGPVCCAVRRRRRSNWTASWVSFRCMVVCNDMHQNLIHFILLVVIHMDMHLMV